MSCNILCSICSLFFISKFKYIIVLRLFSLTVNLEVKQITLLVLVVKHGQLMKLPCQVLPLWAGMLGKKISDGS